MLRSFITATLFSSLILSNSLGGCSSISRADLLTSNPNDISLASKASKTSNSSQFATLEQSIHRQVNQYRQSKKLAPLTLDARISEYARQHSQAMANGKVPFSHQGFEQRVKSINKVIPYRASSENVAYNMGYGDPGKQAVQGWINSRGHRENMEGRYDLTGIGVAKNAKGEYYFTQIFIRRR